MYEFECQKCGHKSEKLLKIDDKTDAIECSKCGGNAIKVFSVSTTRFKGGGWMTKQYS